ncbi:PAS domain-containing protein [Streptomyces sp. NPDC091292]|uniref:hybrid sensor histidine kinase/response regulator n=1 Tax=Streptomyces sp. NPDC091292 TaxID=3365991 RepID=UPI0037F382DD
MSSRPSRGAARLAAILDALPDALVLVNANGTVVNANTIALETFEAPGTALVGRGLLDLLPEFDSRLIPGSMRRPDTIDTLGRTKPKRMIARRTDGGEFPVEVTSANLENGQHAYDGHGGGYGYSGDELLMLVVRDLSGTVDTEAELARSQRQTEMILRAASEGVVGTDTDGRVVLVNPAAAQILGYRASDLGGQELHALVLHSREDGEPFPFEGSPLADTLKSGRKHRVRGQVLWSKKGEKVPVDLTTAPVRDGDQLVGAVLTFTDRRGYDALAAEKDELGRQHAEAVTRLREAHAQELAALAEEHEEQLHAEKDRYAALAEREQDRYEALAERHEQLLAVLDGSLRGPLDELRRELSGLAADDAGQLWPEANQILHHLAAGYARITTLVDNVLGYQRLDSGADTLAKRAVMLDAVVAAGVEGAVELIGPGRAQFAVHAPPIEAEVDPERLANALAHLVADVAGVDATGNAPVAAGGYMDSTIVVAAAQRGEVVRIEVRGPYAGGDPVHEPIVRGIVRAHGGVLQTHVVPGMSGSAFVLEVPIGGGAGTVPPPGVAPDGAGVGTGAGVGAGVDVGAGAQVAVAEQGAGTGGGRGGRRRARRASVDAFLESEVAGDGTGAGTGDDGSSTGAGPESGVPTGRRRGRRAPEASVTQETAGALVAPMPAPGGTDGTVGVAAGGAVGGDASGGTGRRRGRPSPAEGSVVASNEQAALPPGLGQAVPPQGVPTPTGRRARRDDEQQHALPPGATGSGTGTGSGTAMGAAPVSPYALPAGAGAGAGTGGMDDGEGAEIPGQQSGRRARRALGPAPEQNGPRPVFALPPADADRAPTGPEVPTAAQGMSGAPGAQAPGRQVDGRRAPGAGPAGAYDDGGYGHSDLDGHGDTGQHAAALHDPTEDHTPPQPHPADRPTGRRRGQQAEGGPYPGAGVPVPGVPGQQPVPGQGTPGQGIPAQGGPVPAHPAQPTPAQGIPHQGAPAQGTPAPLDPRVRAAQALPAEGQAPTEIAAGDPSSSTQGRAISVRTLGQGVPFDRQIAEQQRATGQPQQTPPHGTQGAPGAQGTQGTLGGANSASANRRRKLATRPDLAQNQPPTPAPEQAPAPGGQPQAQPQAHPHPQSRLATASAPSGRSYAIGAPDEDADEGPEPLDGPGGAVEIADQPQLQPMDDELPPEPLDNPRRLLVWPAPDVSTQQALSDRGYRPVIVHSREEVDAQIAAFPAALFVDPLTGPITRTALQSLRQAAVAAEVPVLVTAGLGQATREAAYGADPAVLLKALAPRDSEQHPPRVLLIEQHAEIALALTATLERRGMQVARAETDADAVTLAAQMRPNLVVMDLMQVRRRRAGIVDWLRANGQLNRTPLVVYTAAVDRTELPRLAAGETVLFLAERSTSTEVQARIVDLLAKIGTN